jgi:hypothetical protein
VAVFQRLTGQPPPDTHTDVIKACLSQGRAQRLPGFKPPERSSSVPPFPFSP